MPRPPPPATALMMTGKPEIRATFRAFSSLSTGPSLPGRIGTPAFFIARRARPCRRAADHVRRGPDELDVARLADLGEVGALGEEAVAGMDRVGAGDLGGAQDRRHVEVAVGAARGPMQTSSSAKRTCSEFSSASE